MKCFVTGASGFIGANLVHELLARGHEVRALLRPGASTLGLGNAPIERIPGDVLDPQKCLAKAMRGCEWVFHVAASYHLWLPDYASMRAVNIEGTRNVLQAASDSGVRRIVHTSTVGCIGLPARTADGKVTPSDEQSPVTATQLDNPYKRSKWEGEQLALGLAARGLPVIIVNPSAPVGPRDVRPTPLGRMIVDLLNGRMPGFVETGLNWVHVRDVAAGHVLAAERGRVGERYILGHAEGNWTLRRALETLSRHGGVSAPRLRVPWSLAYLAACAAEMRARLTGREPQATLAGVRMARHWMWFNPAKAVRELGLPQTPPEEALRDAVEWFRANGYARSQN